jgi:tocopherol cyclase
MWQNWKNIWAPERYHGYAEKAPFFEGWYYKLVCPRKMNIFAIIPGIYFDNNNKQSHAFIQVLDSKNHQTSYHRYSLDAFFADNKSFRLEIGGNLFIKDTIKLNLNSEERRIKGTLYFSGHHPWPVTILSPGVMGWYSFLPFMECYHGVLSFDHEIKGLLEIDGQHVDFSGGRGYTEKDWGLSFPRAYIWMQCNHFQEAGASLFISVARIPWLGRAFRGFLAGFLLKGRLYRFTTYAGARIENLTLEKTLVHLVIRDKKYRLDVKASRTKGGVLFGPNGEHFTQHVSETLKSQLNVIFYENDTILFQGKGYPAGLDINGSTNFII